MTVTITNISQASGSSFMVSYSSNLTPPVTFDVWLCGVNIQTTTSPTGTGQVLITVAANSSPYLEIIDNGDIPHPAYPGTVTLNWRRLANAASYNVQQYVSSSWSTLQTQPETGLGNGIYLTSWLPDNTQQKFQVVPVDAQGVAGTPISYTINVVHHPDVPAASYSYSSGTGEVTITIG